MSIPEKYSHIDFTPPKGVQKEAEYGLKLRREYGRGGTAVGIARARDLANGTQLSPSTLRRMKAFFDRHQSDEKADGFFKGDKNWPSNGLIANKLWGGPNGYAWARKVVAQMEAADAKEEGRALRPFGSTQGLKPKVFVVHGPPASGKTSYVMEKKGDNDVIFDFDKVMSALSGLPPHQKNDNLISYCTDIRTLIIDKALRNPKVDKTWIIATNVSDDLKGKLSDIPVEYVQVDATKEECLKRIEEDPERQPVATELREVVEKYFSQKDEQRSVAVLPNVERRFLGNFSNAEKADPDLLRVEKRADPSTGKQQTYLVGYAAKFHTDSLLLGDFVERIDPGAFDIVKSREDGEGRPLETRCLFNHDPNHLLGRFPTTMKMTVDDKGLRYECLLPESRQDLAESVARGDLRGSSFSFVVAEGGEKWSYEGGQSTRLVTKIKSLLDCGPVTYPAYGDATVAVAKRSYQQFVAKKSGHAESRNQTKAKVAAELAKTKQFLEERAFCATGEGGGVDNSCGAGGNQTDDGGGRVSSAIKGAIAGAVGGGLGGGLVGAVVGAAAIGFAAYVASGKKTDEALEKAKADMGISDTKLSMVSAAVFGKGSAQSIETKVTKDGVIAQYGRQGQMFISKKPPAFGVKGKSNLHFNPNGGGSSIAKDAELAAKSAGVQTVSVQSWSGDHDKALKSAGFKKTGGAFTKSENHDIWIKDLSKKSSKRSYEELSQFIAERRNDCGRGSDGKFSSGNKCQDEDGGEPEKAPPPKGKSSTKPVAAEKHDPVQDSPSKKSGGYMEWKKGKDKEAQDFIDDAREGQLARGGKSGGKSDDGGGVQTWSKGDHFPWTPKQVGTDEGFVQGIHPDGSKTEKYPFKGDSSEAYKKVGEEIAKKKGKRSHSPRQVARDTIRFLKERRK